MIFRNVSSAGAWSFGAGRQNFARDDKAIQLNIETTLKSFESEYFFDTDFGLPWFDLINAQNKDIVILTIKSTIVACYGVMKVQELEYTFTGARELEIKYSILTIYQTILRGVVTI